MATKSCKPEKNCEQVQASGRSVVEGTECLQHYMEDFPPVRKRCSVMPKMNVNHNQNLSLIFLELTNLIPKTNRS